MSNKEAGIELTRVTVVMLVIASMLAAAHVVGSDPLQQLPDALVIVPLSGIVKMTSSYKGDGAPGEACIELVEWGNVPIENIYVPRKPDGTPDAGLPLDCNLFLNAGDAKVGDYVTLKITERDDFRKANGDPRWQQTVRSRLIVIDKNQKIVGIGMEPWAGSAIRYLWTTDVTKTFNINSAAHVYGKSSEFGAFTGFGTEDGIPFGFKKTGEGKETIKIGDTSYDCTWISGNVNIKDDDKLGLRMLPLSSEVKIWMAKNTPSQTQPKPAPGPAKSSPKNAVSNVPPTGVVKVTSSYKIDGVPGEARAEIDKWGNDGRKVTHAYREGVGKLAGKPAGGNPFRNANGIKVGDYVIYKTTEMSKMFANASGREELTRRLSVMDRDEKASSFGPYEYDLSTTDQTQEFDYCTAVAMILQTNGYPYIGLARNSDQVPFGFTKTDEGKETLKIGDKTYDCIWITGKVETRVRENPPSTGSYPFTAEMKIWIANKAPRPVPK